MISLSILLQCGKEALKWIHATRSTLPSSGQSQVTLEPLRHSNSALRVLLAAVRATGDEVEAAATLRHGGSFVVREIAEALRKFVCATGERTLIAIRDEWNHWLHQMLLLLLVASR